ncbi:MAG: glycosyltransferase family 2 protein [Acidobacteriota bacterium]|nr:glycosyltransferase family 2 protein [Acidobacteriota bacterium]
MIDVIVLDIDGGAMIEECIASIRAQSIPSRILIFDNGSKTPTVGATMRSETNLGFAGGANAALRHSSAPYVALVNNDVVLQPDWLEQVRDALDRDEQLAAVQTIITRPDGRIDGAGIDISDGTFRQIGHGDAVGVPLSVAWGVSATATLYRRAAIGDRFFEERFFTYYEDVELSARLRADGWRIAVLPVVAAVHRGSQSAPLLGRRGLRLRARNRYLVARMHPGVGRIRALLWEDARLLLRGRTSIRGIVQGLLWSLSTS